jgi:TetR/AcrR family transcriptional regulator, regulator of cefoperazone and chloramphenicol sensitivity
MVQGRPSRREEYARVTRLDVINAAHRLFLARGYAATSIRAIADEANVSEQTVYRVFGDKAEVLRAVIVTAVEGEDDGASLRESRPISAMAQVDDASARLRIVARWAHDAYDRGLAQLEQMVITAASTDERVVELARFIGERRYEDTRRLVIQIFGDLGPPPGTEIDDAIDYIYAVESSPVYLCLTIERGWSTDKYVEWFVRMFENLFLDPANTTPGSSSTSAFAPDRGTAGSDT